VPDSKYRVRLTENAELDVAGVLAWFHDRAALADGSKWYARLLNAINTLETMPERCGLAEEATDIGEDIRELHFGRRRATYRVLFQVVGRTVNILRIRHSAQDSVPPRDL
jgi:plasmid stabilization system protein ParE